jgi:two-component system response regulator YesN
LIEEQFQDKNLTLDKLSKQLGVSLSHLARLFKKELRVSFRQHLRAVRMKQAGVLLRRSLLSIKEVAASVGYKHVSDFDHHFNMTYGMRPSVYRRVSAKTEAGQMQRDKHQSSISDISEFSAANGKHQLPELP